MPHEDGSAYAPVVATVSLGGSLCLEITRKPSESEDKGEEEGEKGEDVPMQQEQREDIQKKPSTQYQIPTRIFQETRSLLITTGDAYKDLLHGIAPVDVDEDLNAQTVANWSLLADRRVVEDAGGRNVRGTRVSLTYRDVLKVSSAASKVFGGVRR